MNKVYFINLDNVNVNRLIGKLLSLGYKETYLNELSFCPYMIIHKNFDRTKTDVMYENINIGFLERIKENLETIEAETEDEFIGYADDLINGRTDINRLF
jgi:hypothetical protein